MPLFDLRCTECEHVTVDALLRSNLEVPYCPKCGAQMVRLMAVPAPPVIGGRSSTPRAGYGRDPVNWDNYSPEDMGTAQGAEACMYDAARSAGIGRDQAKHAAREASGQAQTVAAEQRKALEAEGGT